MDFFFFLSFFIIKLDRFCFWISTMSGEEEENAAELKIGDGKCFFSSLDL